MSDSRFFMEQPKRDIPDAEGTECLIHISVKQAISELPSFKALLPYYSKNKHVHRFIDEMWAMENGPAWYKRFRDENSPLHNLVKKKCVLHSAWDKTWHANELKQWPKLITALETELELFIKNELPKITFNIMCKKFYKIQ